MPNRSVPAAAPGLPKDHPSRDTRLDDATDQLELLIHDAQMMARICVILWEAEVDEWAECRKAGFFSSHDDTKECIWASWQALDLINRIDRCLADAMNGKAEGVTNG